MITRLILGSALALVSAELRSQARFSFIQPDHLEYRQDRR
jgi:hypothetical protein